MDDSKEAQAAINPHIPQYIAEAPWYLDAKGPSLKHQRLPANSNDKAASKLKANEWYKRGVIKTDLNRKRKYDKGACENCGSHTHVKADCIERPRKKGARWTGRDIGDDEHVPEQNVEGFEAKRDRWGGYNPADFSLLVEEHTELEQEQARLRSPSDSSDDDGVRISDFDSANAPMGSTDDRTRTTTRNLRIREDTAKYLINLNPDSAFFDPKARSMREDPTQGLPEHIKAKLNYKGDNALRTSGLSDLPQQLEVFAWQNYKKGLPLHAQANPTAAALAFREHTQATSQELKERKKAVIEKYAATATAPPKDL